MAATAAGFCFNSNHPSYHHHLLFTTQYGLSSSSNSLTGQAAGSERLRFFSHPSQWCDKGFDKRNLESLECIHKPGGKALWVDDMFSPSSLQAEFSTLHPQSLPHSSSPSSSSSSVECWGEGEKTVETSQASRIALLWQEFFSDPSQWWDLRSDKKYSKLPDFKHKTAKKALWIDNRCNPRWVHAKLTAMPQQYQEQGESTSLKPEFSGILLIPHLLKLSHCWGNASAETCKPTSDIVLRICPKYDPCWFRLAGRAGRIEQLWHEFFSDPSQWWDNRSIKNSPKYPDFKHKITEEGLWIEGLLNPPWVKAKMATMALGQTQSSAGLRAGDAVRKLCQEGCLNEAISILDLMAQRDTKAPINAYLSLLRECARRKRLVEGKQVHTLIFQSGLRPSIRLGNTLIDMYAKCGSVIEARDVFNNMPERNVFSWTAIISAYANHGQGEEAINMYQKMRQTEITPDKVVYVIVLKACARVAALEQGKQLHFDIVEGGFESDLVVSNTLVDMYFKCGCIELACQVFNKMNERDVVSWNAMIAGYVQNGLGKEALALHDQMTQESVQPDCVTYVLLLKACANSAALEQGKQLHNHIIQSSYQSDVMVGNTLVDMYAKCGCIEHACQVFYKMKERTVVTWNAMMEGYAQQGLGKEAVALFEQMQREDIKPDDITYVSVLSACSHSGLVDEGRRLFDSMCKDHHITPSLKHYACMVDLLGRAGCLSDAEDLINKIPNQPDAVVWMTLLGAARNHGHVEVGRRAFDCVVKLEPENSAAYVLLSNIYAAAGRMDEVANLRKEMKDASVRELVGAAGLKLTIKA